MSTHEPHGTVLLGVIELKEAKRLRAALAERGVALELLSNPQTCSTGGCAVTVELRARPEDVEAFAEFLRGERDRALEGLEVDPARLEAVFDPEAAEATCPACGTRFAPTAAECPDCGLGFGGPPGAE